VWEFWAYNIVFGLFQAPYYAFSQTMMAELSPPGFDNMVRPSPSPDALSKWGKNLVLWFIRAVESRIVNDRAERDPIDHQQVGQ
jgi:hypothetical protein